MNRVYIKTYGCQMNERDSEAVAALLSKRGYRMVAKEDEADVILLNTCSVRDQAEQKAIGKAGHLMKLKRRQKNLKIGIIGCMAQNRGRELIERLPDLDLLVGTQKFHRVPALLDELMKAESVLSPEPSTLVDLEEEAGSQDEIRLHLPTSGIKPSAFVSIMQGCNMRCSFCIVPKTRGDERSRSIEDIVEEVEELAAGGTREITLLGQIVTSYGRGLIAPKNGKGAFVQLIEKVAEVPGIDRVRFTSPHPTGFREDLIEAYRDIPELMPYVHLPLQSGSDRMLKAMRRPYSVKRFMEIVSGLKAAAPSMTFSTDIIVGYPGESDKDFAMTVEVFDAVRFDMAFIFKYSPRSGTRSAEMEDDVPQLVKEDRNQILLKKLERYSIESNESLLGTDQLVLVERPARRGENMYQGRNPGNRKVIFQASEDEIGQIVPVRINSATVSSVMGEMVL